MIPRSDKLAHDAIVKHLMDEGAEYIDMTHKGGGLYFFSQSVAEELKAKGYNYRLCRKGQQKHIGQTGMVSEAMKNPPRFPGTGARNVQHHLSNRNAIIA